MIFVLLAQPGISLLLSSVFYHCLLVTVTSMEATVLTGALDLGTSGRWAVGKSSHGHSFMVALTSGVLS